MSEEVILALDKRLSELSGSVTTDVEAQELYAKLPSSLVPTWLVSLLQDFPLVGTCFSLTEHQDQSGLGAELRWFSVSQIVEEALDAYPGRSVVELGYVPVAACLFGSGDPYFLRIGDGSVSDPALVRVPHDFVAKDGSFPEDKIEIVCEALSRFFEIASIED